MSEAVAVRTSPPKAVSRFSVEQRVYIRTLIGQRVKELRKDRNETQSECAAMFGAHESYFRQIESGTKDTSMWRYLEIADFFNVDLAELFRYVK